LIASLLLALLAPAPGLSAPLSDACAGTWRVQGTWTVAQANGVTITVDFQQDGGTVGGTTTTSTGVPGDVTGSVTGNTLDFVVNWQVSPPQRGHYILQLGGSAASGSTVDEANPGRPGVGVSGTGPLTCSDSVSSVSTPQTTGSGIPEPEAFDPSSVSTCWTVAGADPRFLTECLQAAHTPSPLANAVLNCYQPLVPFVGDAAAGDAFQQCLSAATALTSPPESASDCWTKVSDDPLTAQKCVQSFGASAQFASAIVACYQPMRHDLQLWEQADAFGKCVGVASARANPPESLSDCWTKLSGDPLTAQTCMQSFGASAEYASSVLVCYQSAGGVRPIDQAETFGNCVSVANALTTPPTVVSDCWTQVSEDPRTAQECMQSFGATAQFASDVLVCYQPQRAALAPWQEAAAFRDCLANATH
jgi:hypothetical protein